MQLTEGRLRILQLAHDAAGVGQEEFAAGRKFHATPDAVEQKQVQLILKLSDLM
jgi:hypothetical protein